MLGSDLGVRPHRLPSNKGVQIGSCEKAKYVTIFDNGSIVSQGLMGLHYGVNVIARKLMDIVIDRSNGLECSKQRRSQKFKDLIRMFGKSESHREDKKKCNSKMSPVESNTNSESAPLTCSKCDHVIAELRSQLKEALLSVKRLEGEVVVLQQASSQKSEETPTMMAQICARLEVIERDQKEIKSTFGAQIAGAIRKAQIGASPTSESSKQNNQNVQPLANAQDQSLTPSRGWETMKTTNYKKSSIKHQSEEFRPENTLVIYDFAEQAQSDRVIRQLISKASTHAVVKYINRTGERNPKYMVQFSTAAMKDEVLKNWNNENLGGSKVRNPIKDPKLSHVGYAKHVPVDMESEDIDEALREQYPGSTHKRIAKGGKNLETVRVTFSSEEQIEEACLRGVSLPGYGYRAPVSRENPRIVFTQCYKCWKFGHIAKNCGSNERCKVCGGDHHHDICESEKVMCSNCKLPHAADIWKDCLAFHKYKAKCEERFSRHHGSD